MTKMTVKSAHTNGDTPHGRGYIERPNPGALLLAVDSLSLSLTLSYHSYTRKSKTRGNCTYNTRTVPTSYMYGASNITVIYILVTAVICCEKVIHRNSHLIAMGNQVVPKTEKKKKEFAPQVWHRPCALKPPP